MGQFATLATITKVEAMPGNSRLEVVSLSENGQRAVVNHGEYKPGNIVVFFEAGAALPADDQRYAFLREKYLHTWQDKQGKVRKQVIHIKAVKIKGITSQGVVMPVSAFPEMAAIMNGEDEDDILQVRNFSELDREMKTIINTAN